MGISPLWLFAQERPTFNKYVDRKAFPEGYGILTSDRLMYPANVSTWPVKIDSRRQLFIDDYLIASTEGLRREFHQPVKHPKNPLIQIDRPWEQPVIALGYVLQDPKTRRLRMWYNVATSRVLYAESSDGIVWTKPQLGILEYAGSKQNNIVIEGGFIVGLMPGMKDPRSTDGYQAVVWSESPTVPETGFYLYRSPDGLHWAKALTTPIVTSTANTKLYNTISMGDTSIFRYDTALARYVCDSKTNIYLPLEAMKQLGMIPDNQNRIRSRAMMESDDLIHWTPPRMTLFPDDRDGPDAQIYGHIAFEHESMWLGMARILHIQRSGWKQTEVQLTFSRDGRHWSRPDIRKEFIPLGAADGWEPDYTDPAYNGPLLVDDELWFYYRGSRSAERDRIKNYTMRVGLAKLRRDGFVSLNASGKPGQLVTRPLTTAGRSLFVNVEIGKGGWLKAAVLSTQAQPIASRTFDKSNPITSSITHGRVTWRDAEYVEIPADSHVRLAFQLKDAKLYSFVIE